jgi:uncharacterized membrane protein required for colicin V production
MSESTVLDALLGAIILLVALIGYWQGIVRSLILIAGAMIGSELALWWSDEAGDWLSDVLPLNPDTGRFVASTAFIVGASLLLGVTLGNMTARPAFRARDRFTGIAVSLAAAVLIIGLIIRYFHVHMATEADDALGETRLALALWEQFDWIVLVTAIGGVLMAVLYWILGAPGSESRAISSPSATANAWSGTARSSSSPPIAQTPTMQRANSRHQTMPSDDYAAYRSNNHAEPSASRSGSEQARQANLPAEDQPAARAEPDTTTSIAGFEAPPVSERTSPSRSSIAQTSEFDRQYAPVASTLSFSTDEVLDSGSSSGICPNCGMLLTSGDQFCPDCGHPVEEPSTTVMRLPTNH